jgi:anti-sigma B factor antagonist
VGFNDLPLQPCHENRELLAGFFWLRALSASEKWWIGRKRQETAQMQMEIAEKGDVSILRALEKRIDAGISGELKERLAEMVEEGNRLIILDISMVEFLDSSGLGAIISGLKAIGEDGKLVICGATDPVKSMFKLTRMDRIFEMYDTEAESLQAFEQGN